MDHVGGRPAIAEPSRRPTEREREEAFARLIDGELPRSYRMARLILRNDADAEDAIQDAVVSAWRHWRELRDQGRFDAWFGRIVANRCRDRLRRPARLREVDLAPEIAHGLDQGYLRAEQQLDIARAFDALNPDQRIVVVLRYWSDLTMDQIAERVHAPAGTVKSRLHNALARLRATLERSEVSR